MIIKIISDTDGLDVIKNDWCDLFSSEGNSIFQSFEFNYYSWKAELSMNQLNKLCVVIVYTSKQVSSILPLYVDSKKALRFINDQHADYCDVLTNNKFDIKTILFNISKQFKFYSVHFINLRDDSALYTLFNKGALKNSLIEPCGEYSDLAICSGSFPEKIPRYTSKQKTEFRRVKKKNKDNSLDILCVEFTAFPENEINLLKVRMVELGLRRSSFLDHDRVLLLKELYNSKKMIISRVKNKSDVHAISFILRHDNEYLFWIDMYDATKMINIYNYILFIENISINRNVNINFGRGIYHYKLMNFKPDIKRLFAVYVFVNQFRLIVFLCLDRINNFLKFIYKRIKI